MTIEDYVQSLNDNRSNCKYLKVNIIMIYCHEDLERKCIY